MIDNVKLILYWMMVFCYAGVGSIELFGRHWKPGILAIGFGILNALIFIWKPRIGG